MTIMNAGIGLDAVIPLAEPIRREDSEVLQFNITYQYDGQVAYIRNAPQISPESPYEVTALGNCATISDAQNQTDITVRIKPNVAVEPWKKGDVFSFSGLARSFPTKASLGPQVGLAFPVGLAMPLDGLPLNWAFNDSETDSPAVRLQSRPIALTEDVANLQFSLINAYGGPEFTAGDPITVVYSFALARSGVTKSAPELPPAPTATVEQPRRLRLTHTPLQDLPRISRQLENLSFAAPEMAAAVRRRDPKASLDIESIADSDY